MKRDMCIRKGKLAARGEEIERERINSCGVFDIVECNHVYCNSSNRRCTRIVAATSKRGMCPCVRMVFDDGNHASASTVLVVRFVPTADSRAERLHVLGQHLATITVSLVRTLSGRR